MEESMMFYLEYVQKCVHAHGLNMCLRACMLCHLVKADEDEGEKEAKIQDDNDGPK